jgi:hypothetical protein
VVIHDLDVERIVLGLGETHAPLIVDPDALLSRALALELLEPVAGWDTEVLERAGAVQHHQFPSRRSFDRSQPWNLEVVKEVLGGP